MFYYTVCLLYRAYLWHWLEIKQARSIKLNVTKSIFEERTVLGAIDTNKKKNCSTNFYLKKEDGPGGFQQPASVGYVTPRTSPKDPAQISSKIGCVTPTRARGSENIRTQQLHTPPHATSTGGTQCTPKTKKMKSEPGPWIQTGPTAEPSGINLQRASAPEEQKPGCATLVAPHIDDERLRPTSGVFASPPGASAPPSRVLYLRDTPPGASHLRCHHTPPARGSTQCTPPATRVRTDAGASESGPVAEESGISMPEVMRFPESGEVIGSGPVAEQSGRDMPPWQPGPLEAPPEGINFLWALRLPPPPESPVAEAPKVELHPQLVSESPPRRPKMPQSVIDWVKAETKRGCPYCRYGIGDTGSVPELDSEIFSALFKERDNLFDYDAFLTQKKCPSEAEIGEFIRGKRTGNEGEFISEAKFAKIITKLGRESVTGPTTQLNPGLALGGGVHYLSSDPAAPEMTTGDVGDSYTKPNSVFDIPYELVLLKRPDSDDNDSAYVSEATLDFWNKIKKQIQEDCDKCRAGGPGWTAKIYSGGAIVPSKADSFPACAIAPGVKKGSKVFYPTIEPGSSRLYRAAFEIKSPVTGPHGDSEDGGPGGGFKWLPTHVFVIKVFSRIRSVSESGTTKTSMENCVSCYLIPLIDNDMQISSKPEDAQNVDLTRFQVPLSLLGAVMPFELLGGLFLGDEHSTTCSATDLAREIDPEVDASSDGGDATRRVLEVLRSATGSKLRKSMAINENRKKFDDLLPTEIFNYQEVIDHMQGGKLKNDELPAEAFKITHEGREVAVPKLHLSPNSLETYLRERKHVSGAALEDPVFDSDKHVSFPCNLQFSGPASGCGASASASGGELLTVTRVKVFHGAPRLLQAPGGCSADSEASRQALRALFYIFILVNVSPEHIYPPCCALMQIRYNPLTGQGIQVQYWNARIEGDEATFNTSVASEEEATDSSDSEAVSAGGSASSSGLPVPGIASGGPGPAAALVLDAKSSKSNPPSVRWHTSIDPEYAPYLRPHSTGKNKLDVLEESKQLQTQASSQLDKGHLAENKFLDMLDNSKDMPPNSRFHKDLGAVIGVNSAPQHPGFNRKYFRMVEDCRRRLVRSGAFAEAVQMVFHLNIAPTKSTSTGAPETGFRIRMHHIPVMHDVNITEVMTAETLTLASEECPCLALFRHLWVPSHCAVVMLLRKHSVLGEPDQYVVGIFLLPNKPISSKVPLSAFLTPEKEFYALTGIRLGKFLFPEEKHRTELNEIRAELVCGGSAAARVKLRHPSVEVDFRKEALQLQEIPIGKETLLSSLEDLEVEQGDHHELGERISYFCKLRADAEDEEKRETKEKEEVSGGSGSGGGAASAAVAASGSGEAAASGSGEAAASDPGSVIGGGGGAAAESGSGSGGSEAAAAPGSGAKLEAAAASGPAAALDSGGLGLASEDSCSVIGGGATPVVVSGSGSTSGGGATPGVSDSVSDCVCVCDGGASEASTVVPESESVSTSCGGDSEAPTSPVVSESESVSVSEAVEAAAAPGSGSGAKLDAVGVSDSSAALAPGSGGLEPSVTLDPGSVSAAATVALLDAGWAGPHVNQIVLNARSNGKTYNSGAVFMGFLRNRPMFTGPLSQNRVLLDIATECDLSLSTISNSLLCLKAKLNSELKEFEPEEHPVRVFVEGKQAMYGAPIEKKIWEAAKNSTNSGGGLLDRSLLTSLLQCRRRDLDQLLLKSVIGNGAIKKAKYGPEAVLNTLLRNIDKVQDFEGRFGFAEESDKRRGLPDGKCGTLEKCEKMQEEYRKSARKAFERVVCCKGSSGGGEKIHEFPPSLNFGEVSKLKS